MPKVLTATELPAAKSRLVELYPALQAIVTHNPGPSLEKEFDSPFLALVVSIIHQQISTKAARTITNRLTDLLNGNITPHHVLSLSDQQLQEVGISKQKRSYLKDLSVHFLQNPAWETQLLLMDDDAIVECLIPIKGIGLWSVQMFLIFTLWHADVWPVADLGIKHGMKRLLKQEELPIVKEVESFGAKAAGHRTLLAWYLWRIAGLPNGPDAESLGY